MTVSSGGERGARGERGVRAGRAARWLVAAALLGSFPACGGGGSKPAGALFVKVTDRSMAPVSDAVVTTDPHTVTLATDALGSVFFARVPAGSYAVTASHPTVGSGRTTVQVMANDVADVTIVLTAPSLGGSGGAAGAGGAAGTGGSIGGGGGRGGGPGVGGSSGTGGSGGAGAGGGAGGAAGIGGSGGRGGSAGVAGVAGTGGSAGSGAMAGRGGTGGTSTGGAGTAGSSTGGSGTGGTGGTGGSTATLVLAALSKDSNGVNMSWTATPTSAFSSYRIYRGSSTSALSVINILNDATAAQYRDETGILGVSYTYRVGGVTPGGTEVLSNTQTIVTGVYIDVASQIQTMLVDRTRPYLYGLDKVNNSLHFINLSTNTVDKTIFIGSSPVDMDINLEGTTLYVANFGSTMIATVDLDTRAMTGTIFVDTSTGTWQGNPYKVVCTAGDTLVFTSMDQWNSLKLVNALTGGSLDAVGSIFSPDLAASPDGLSVYAGENGISTETLSRWDVVNGKLMSVDVSAGINSYSGGFVLMTRDGKYVFYAGMKFLAKNLKSVLGTFSEGIVAINSDGSLAVGANHIFDGTTFAAKKMTPLSTSTMAISPDDTTLYLYDATTSRIYLYRLQ
jgi:hypothetical protein